MTIFDVVTLSLAILGASLGVINTWRAFDRDQVKLSVRPKQAFPIGEFSIGKKHLCINVLNLSTFPVVIAEIGIKYYFTKNRGVILKPLIIDGGSMPRRLESRTSFSIYIEPDDVFKLSKHWIRCAYAKTDCGETAVGTSPAFKQLIKEARSS